MPEHNKQDNSFLQNFLLRDFHASFAVFALVLILSPAFAQDSVRPGDDPEVKELEKLTVTGTRIKRSDIEGSLPVSIFDRKELEQSGNAIAADFLRSLPFNSFGSWRAAPGSTEQGESLLEHFLERSSHRRGTECIQRIPRYRPVRLL